MVQSVLLVGVGGVEVEVGGYLGSVTAYKM